MNVLHALAVGLALTAGAPGTPGAPGNIDLTAATANDALQKLADAAGWGLVLKTGPAGDAPLQIRIHDASPQEALDIILSASDLDGVLNGHTLIVKAGPGGDNGSDEDDHPRRRRRHSHDRNVVGTGDVTIPDGESREDVVTIGGSIHLGAGAKSHDLVAIGGSVDVEPNALVTGDAVAVGGHVQVAPGAKVSGDAVAVGGRVKADAADVGHGISEVAPSFWRMLLGSLAVGGIGMGMFSPFFVIGSALAKFAVLLCFGAILTLAAPKHLTRIENAIGRIPVRMGVMGFAGTLALPFLSLLLIVTIVGIPLLAVELFALALGALMGFTALAIWLGRRLPLPIWPGSDLPALAVGAAILALLSAIPLFGALASITGWFLVFGAVLYTRFGSAGSPNEL